MVAGVSRETAAANAEWAVRLHLPYPLLSDRDGAAGNALGAVRVLSIAGWSLQLMRRATYLIDTQGIVAATWSRVRVRGHAREVLDAVRALPSSPTA
jgi:peroxiredoxin Q/BCP